MGRQGVRRGASLAVVALVLFAARASGASDFRFTKIDLQLLREADQLDEYFERSGLVYEDPGTNQYVESVGRAMLPAGPAPEHVTWAFRVLRDPEPNAFALPNGSVYIHTGLLSLMQNEAQLAGVLAHEETHVLNRHAYLENRSVRKKVAAVNILGAVGSVAAYGYGTGAIVASAVSGVASNLLVATVFGYSRELEQEADLRALGAVEKAGYRPEELVETFRLLERSEGPDSGPALYSDHPRLEARAQYLTQAIQANPPAPGSLRVGRAKYDEAAEAVCRHDIGLEISADRRRRAMAIARHLVEEQSTSEHYLLLGEACRAMGGRLPDPSSDQLSAERKRERKMLSKMTRQEYEKALLALPDGKAAWEDNRRQAETAYQKAIQLDAANAKAHRGLGLIYDDEKNAAGAIAEFQKYLQLAPLAWDRMEIQKALARLQAPGGGQ